MHTAGEPPPALPAQRPAAHPRPGPGGQLDIHGARVVTGQRPGCMTEERDLVAGVERVPRLVVHQYHVAG
jgi:hypothetical protein